MEYPNVRLPISDEDFTKIAQAIFEEDERMLPEGRTWTNLDISDIAAYCNMAKAAIRCLMELNLTSP